MKYTRVLCIFICVAAFLSAAEQATIKALGGSVSVIRMLKKIEPIAAGFELQPKDIVVTGEKSFADIELPNESAAKVGADSRMKMTSFLKDAAGARNTSLELFSGTSAFNVNPLRNQNESFTVKTPVAVAGVRGTRFVVRHLRQRGRRFVSSVMVIKGAVGVGSAIPSPGAPPRSPVLLQSMEVSEVSAEAPPSAPRRISPEEAKEVQQALGGGDAPAEAKGEDNGTPIDSATDPLDSLGEALEEMTTQAESTPVDAGSTREALRETIKSVVEDIREQIRSVVTETVKTEIQVKRVGRPTPPPHVANP